jgi:hypothetical protein
MKWKGPSGLALGAVVATAAIGLGGVAVAVSTGDERAADFAEALSAQTGQQITAEDVRAAQLQVLEDRLDEAVAAGDLTQERADEMLERAKNGEGPGFGGPGMLGGPGGGPGMHGRGFAAVGDALESLGLDEGAARQAREDGKTLAEYAEGEGVPRAKLIEALKSELTAEAKEHGREADADRVAALAEAIADGDGGPGAGPRGPVTP